LLIIMSIAVSNKQVVPRTTHNHYHYHNPHHRKMVNHEEKMSKKSATKLDDCDRPACADVQSMFNKAMQAANTSDNAGSTPRVGKSNEVECPPNGAAIGQGSWTLLHSMVSHLHFHVDQIVMLFRQCPSVSH